MWPLNDLKAEDQGHVKVNLKILTGELPFLAPDSEWEDKCGNGVEADLVSEVKVIWKSTYNFLGRND